MSHFASRVLCGAVALALLGLAAAPDASATDGRDLVLGRISTAPRKHLDRLRALADYLAARLADRGITGSKVVVVDSPDAMRDLLRQGKVDLFSETAFTALDLSAEGLARPLLREWKNGVAEYHTVVFARKDSGIRSLGDLSGRKFAFEDPGSTSGYLMPRCALEQAGLKLKKLDNPRQAPSADTLGYAFAEGEINVVAWVNRGLTDAGAISNLDWNDPEAAPALFRRDLTIIYETAPVIRSVMLVRESLDPDLADAIAGLLEAMDESSAGRAVLEKYFRVARYDRLEGAAAQGLESARRIWLRAGADAR